MLILVSFPKGHISEIFILFFVARCQGTDTDLACYWSGPVGAISGTLTLHSSLGSKVNKFSLAPCGLSIHLLFLWATEQKAGSIQAETDWWGTLAIDCRESLRYYGRKKLQNKSQGLDLLKSDNTHTAHSHAAPAVGWLTRSSCAASGGELMARTCSKHRPIWFAAGCSAESSLLQPSHAADQRNEGTYQ